MQIMYILSISKSFIRWPLILFVSAFGLITSIAVGGVGHLLKDIPTSQVKVVGDFTYLDHQLFANQLSTKLRTPFLDTQLEDVIEIVVAHPWVLRASARRIWPNTLEIKIVERKPLAIFNENSLLASDGIVFDPGHSEHSDYIGLPLLYGPPETALAVWQHYQVFQRRFERVNRTIESTTLGDDLGWLIVLEEGPEVRLGRTNLLTRLRRVEEILGKPSEIEIAMAKKIDARYLNGVAVEWKRKL